jgi:hypothetical protein
MKGESRFSSAAVPKEAGQSAASGLQAARRRKWQLRPFGQEGPPHIGRQSAKLVKERSKSKRKSKSKSRGERTPLSYPSCHAPYPCTPDASAAGARYMSSDTLHISEVSFLLSPTLPTKKQTFSTVF